MFFQVNVKYDKIQENGAVKKVSEPYIVDACSFTETEARVCLEITGEMEVSAAKRTKIAEIFEDYEGDRYYSVVAALALEEKTTKVSYLVKAFAFRDALNNFEDAMKDTMADYEIVSITETAIMDVFHVKKEEE